MCARSFGGVRAFTAKNDSLIVTLCGLHHFSYNQGPLGLLTLSYHKTVCPAGKQSHLLALDKLHSHFQSITTTGSRPQSQRTWTCERKAYDHWFQQIPSLRNNDCVLYSCMRWPFRCDHNRRQSGGSGKNQNVFYSQVLEVGGMAHYTGPLRRTPAWSGGRRAEEGHDPYWSFLGKGKESKVSSLELAGFNNFSSLWIIGVISTCLVTGPGMIKAEE